MPRTRPYREREEVLADALDRVERDAAERRERDQQQAVCSMECSHAYEVSTNLIPAALDEQCTGRAMRVVLGVLQAAMIHQLVARVPALA